MTHPERTREPAQMPASGIDVTDDDKESGADDPLCSPTDAAVARSAARNTGPDCLSVGFIARSHLPDIAAEDIERRYPRAFRYGTRDTGGASPPRSPRKRSRTIPWEPIKKGRLCAPLGTAYHRLWIRTYRSCPKIYRTDRLRHLAVRRHCRDPHPQRCMPPQSGYRSWHSPDRQTLAC